MDSSMLKQLVAQRIIQDLSSTSDTYDSVSDYLLLKIKSDFLECTHHQVNDNYISDINEFNFSDLNLDDEEVSGLLFLVVENAMDELMNKFDRIVGDFPDYISQINLEYEQN
ncbi:uncharacterized protein ASCRUDRAFT_78050 [Ascoidea rubescens DSM 1968]|uniref:Uncharacterized protein n=1 Tax=Ascoidea rubescens DSM 1968 TaxID=1344418 RepID=A0A1D2V991_9ASCO|nr:hypothetical protein ASCRUDRAFT_78050 [Ascoidea rubescens DSM 1968]ODV58129.1 hypothetical protein ASCRUDRAFT_78050 [Ascoidea rubescens DSM 1968]